MISPKNPTIQATLELLDQPLVLETLPIVLKSGKRIRIKKLDITRDLSTIYHWVNQPYAIPFWQMNVPFPALQADCEEWLQNPATHCLVTYLDECMLCQFDIYETTSDSLQDYYDAKAGDIGIHLLMSPGKKPEAFFTTKILYLLLHFLFCNPSVQRVVCEPDIKNKPACNLVERLGFHLENRLDLPNKTANLYILPRQRFQSSTLL